MIYFRSIAVAFCFLTFVPVCLASHHTDECLVKASIHRIREMSELNKFLDSTPIPESSSKKAKVEEQEGGAVPAQLADTSQSDLRNCLIVFDFDENLAFETIAALGPDFEKTCRILSAEIFRVDKSSFEAAAEILQTSVNDMNTSIRPRFGPRFTSQYNLLEENTKELLVDLRKRSAHLFVCSGNTNNWRRTEFLQQLGFEGEKDYFYESGDKTQPFITYREANEFSKVIFIDNRKENVYKFVLGLGTYFKQHGSSPMEIVGLHYTYFHDTLTPQLLAEQYRQLKIFE